jgi:hypothetical protein
MHLLFLEKKILKKTIIYSNFDHKMVDFQNEKNKIKIN